MSDHDDPVRSAFDHAEDIAPDPDLGEADAGGDPRGPNDAQDDLLERLQEAATFPLNDLGNGQRFVVHFGSESLWVPRVGWFVWTGRFWEKDSDELAIRARVQRLSQLITEEVPHLRLSPDERAAIEQMPQLAKKATEIEAITGEDRTAELTEELVRVRARITYLSKAKARHEKRVGRHLSFAQTTGNSARMDNALKEAGVTISRAFDDLDCDPLTVNCESGTLRFRRVDLRDEGAGISAEVALCPHEREDHLTKMVPAPYDADATCPLFDAFLERVQPDVEMRRFLQRWLGLSLSGLPMQKLAFFYGGGANGKSVLVDVIARIAGSYAATARIESLTGQNRRGGGDATPDLIPLMGARLVRTSEPDEGQRLQEGLIKELTGGEPLLVRALHSDFIEVRPEFKLTISGNHKPDIRGTDDGIWRRVMLVPFNVQIPEEERDEGLADRLFENERAGILRWLVEGLCEVLETGLAPPDAVLEATQEYREEQDPIGVFLTSCCVISGDPADSISAADIGHAFAYHLIERGMTAWKPSTFARRIAPMAGQWRHPQTGMQFAKAKSSRSKYQGIRLTETFKRRFELAPKDQNGRPLGVSEHAEADARHPDSAL